MKRKLVYLIALCLILLVSCGKKSADNNLVCNDPEVLYSGFMMVDARETSSYSMAHEYVITNESDWNTWSKRYDLGYYPDTLELSENMNWEEDCLITLALMGAKDFYNGMNAVDAISFENNAVKIEFGKKTNVCAISIRYPEEKHIVFYVIKVKKPENFSEIDAKYFEYTTVDNVQ